MVALTVGTSDVSDISAEDLLWEWVRQGWRYRKIGARPRAEQDWYAARVKREMDMILGKELADFMLFTSDTIRWAKDHGIPIGPGRGSTAASVVAWLLRITEVDPHKYQGMIFERFLDVSRADPPDIDVDCSDERRHEVWEYLAQKYGPDCVGHIGNFVRYKAKNSLADVARVYDIPKWMKEQVANVAIERSGGDSRADATLEDTFDLFPAAQAIRDLRPEIMKAVRLEGDVRSMSVHACGLVIANSPLTDICAVYERNGERVLSIDKYDAEYIDALKLDFLGLSTMGMIARAIDMAGITLEDLYAVPDDDPETLRIFKRNDLAGIFQFSGRATRLVNREVSPDHFGHLTDINALSRPGPLFSGQEAEYVEVRHGRRQPARMHPLVDEITAGTYGQIIYQEQILRILKEIGGFDWFEVGQIRRIISKKLGEAAFQMSRDQFYQGAADSYGINQELAKQIWDRLVTSGTYSFNIAHAVSYTMLAFWTGWLKAHYPVEFYAASLAKTGDKDEQFRLMRDALAHSVDVKPPDRRISGSTWKAVHVLHERPELQRAELVAGWRQVNGCGEKMSERIAEAFPDGFESWDDLLTIPGIGERKIQVMQYFCAAKDPFGLYLTQRKLRAVKRWLRTDGKGQAPLPTHNGDQIAAINVGKVDYGAAVRKWQPGVQVIYMGVVRKVEIKDIAEDERSRTGKEMEEILASLKRPDLLKRATLHCYDETDEEVYLRINRWRFPKFIKRLQTIRVNHDVIVCAGERIAGFGTPVKVDLLYVIDPT
jgi:DNA polymerase III subunit alpha